MSKLRTSLLAAIALLPTLASAQMSPSDQNRPNGRYDRSAPIPQANPAPQQAPGQPGFDRRGDRPGNGPGDGRGFGGREGGDRPRGDDRRAFAPGEPAPDRAPGRWGPNAPGGQGGYAGRDGDRRLDGNDRRDRRPGDGRDWNGRRDGFGDQRSFDGRPGFDNRRGWNDGRGLGPWRNDRRYDWRGWRDRNRSLFRGPRYIAPRGYGYRPFSIGIRLDPFFYGRNYWLDDPYQYRLPPAYGPYRWVRYFDDVLLVDVETGTVVDVINRFFW